MPIYEYECGTCHHQFEVQQKFSDPLIEKCIQCGNGVRKLISASGIMFKGTGWYVTDYSNKLKDPSQSKQSGNQAKDGAGSDSKTEKPPAKSESGSTPDTSSASPPSSTPSSAASDAGSSSSSAT